MTATLDPSVPAPPVLRSNRRSWAGFTVVMAAMLMNLLDSTILNVASASVQRDLHASTAQLEWVVAAYTLAIAVGLLPGGRLGDRYGRRTMLLIGLSGFTAASIGCACAWSPSSLIVFRIVQGLAAALLTPQTFGLIRDLFPPERIGQAFAAFGPVIGLSLVAGPVVSGLLLKADLFGTDWRALFLINVPLGGFAIIAGLRLLPPGRRNDAVRIDLLGAGIIAVASFLLVFPLVDGRTLGWPAWVFALPVAAVPTFALFAAQQRRRGQRGRAPLLESSVLRKRSYVSGTLFTLVFFGTVSGFALTIGLFLQLGLGFTPMHAALFLAALSIGATVGSGVGAWATTAIGRPILHVGLTVMTVGVLVLLVALPATSGTPGAGTLLPGLAVFGLGMGMIFVPLFSIIMGEIGEHEVGSGSAVLEALQQLGSSLGVAVLATVFFGRLALERGGAQAARAAGREITAAQATLWATLGLIVVAFALGWLLPRRARPQG